jgi:hypothetical protein
MVHKLRTYVPKRRLGIRKEATVPFLFYISSKIVTLGGFLTFLASSFVLSFKSFFMAKNKIREIQSRNERVLDLRRTRRSNSINVQS